MSSHPIRTLAFLFTTFPPEVTGSAYYNWERVKWLAAQGNYRVVVLAPDWQGKMPLPAVPAELSARLTVEGYPSKPWLLYKLLQVPTRSAGTFICDLLAHHQPDLITVVDLERLFWFSTWHLPGSQYAKAHNIPYITEYHTDYYNHIGTYPGGNLIQKLFLKPVHQRLYHQCDQSLAISTAAHRGLQQLAINNARLVHLYGLSLGDYKPENRSRQWITPWLSPEEEDHKFILFVGRLAAEKRIDILIEAFKQLKTRFSHSSLLIVGDGPTDEVDRLKRLAESTDHIHFTGFIQGSTKANLLASCDVYCSPAPHETFGRTMVEAMASGVPVVTVNSGGVTEYIDDGNNGYLVPANKPSALAAQLERTLTGDNSKLITQALATAESLSLERGCKNLEHYYQELLGLVQEPALV